MKDSFIDVLTKLNNLAGASQLAHWNITGDGGEFYSLHLLFGRVYEMVSSHLDPLAEQARGSKIEIPAKVFHDVPEIDWENGKELAEELHSIAEELCEAMETLHKECDEEGEYGILNLIEGAMTDLRSVKYLLGSSCGKV